MGNRDELEQYPWLRRIPPEWRAYHLMRWHRFEWQVSLIAKRAHDEIRLEEAVERVLDRMRVQRRQDLIRLWMSGATCCLFAALIMWAGMVN